MINQAQLLAQLQRAQTLHGAGRTEDAWVPRADRAAMDIRPSLPVALIAQTRPRSMRLRLPCYGSSDEREPRDRRRLATFSARPRHDESLTQ